MSRKLTFVFHIGIVLTVVSSIALARDSSEVIQIQSDSFGRAGGSTHTLQCSGWYPDWVSQYPIDPAKSFQLSQEYFQGIPEFSGEDSLVNFLPPEPILDRPWMAFEFNGEESERIKYAESLIAFAHEGMGDVNFDPNQAGARRWYHAPMMHTNPKSRREPLKGLTSERGLRPSEYDWVKGFLRTYAIGYYDQLASHTLAQVFSNANPADADTSNAEFVDGSYVFKLIFSEYEPDSIESSLDPLVGAPVWKIQDIATGGLIEVRLTQVDVAVKDPRAKESGWVFATYAYHKELNSTEPNPWKRLVPVGYQWGADGKDSPGGESAVNQSWINPDLQAVWANHLGLNGRLNGPIDNPASSCMSCHSTAQVNPALKEKNGDSIHDFEGVGMLPTDTCDTDEFWLWYRDLPRENAFGHVNPETCEIDTVASREIDALDYSLQLKVALVSALFYENANPCANHFEIAPPLPAAEFFSTPKNNSYRNSVNQLSKNNIKQFIIDNKLDLRFQDQVTGTHK